MEREDSSPHLQKPATFVHLRLKNWRLTWSLFLGAFTKLRKATISFIMSVHSSVRMEQLGSHCTDFDETWYLSFFSKICAEYSSFIKIQQK